MCIDNILSEASRYPAQLGPHITCDTDISHLSILSRSPRASDRTTAKLETLQGPCRSHVVCSSLEEKSSSSAHDGQVSRSRTSIASTYTLSPSIAATSTKHVDAKTPTISSSGSLCSFEQPTNYPGSLYTSCDSSSVSNGFCDKRSMAVTTLDECGTSLTPTVPKRRFISQGKLTLMKLNAEKEEHKSFQTTDDIHDEGPMYDYHKNVLVCNRSNLSLNLNKTIDSPLESTRLKSVINNADCDHDRRGNFCETSTALNLNSEDGLQEEKDSRTGKLSFLKEFKHMSTNTTSRNFVFGEVFPQSTKTFQVFRDWKNSSGNGTAHEIKLPHSPTKGKTPSIPMISCNMKTPKQPKTNASEPRTPGAFNELQYNPVFDRSFTKNNSDSVANGLSVSCLYSELDKFREMGDFEKNCKSQNFGFVRFHEEKTDSSKFEVLDQGLTSCGTVRSLKPNISPPVDHPINPQNQTGLSEHISNQTESICNSGELAMPDGTYNSGLFSTSRSDLSDQSSMKYRVKEKVTCCNMTTSQHGVTVTLLNSNLWKAFSAIGTEMIINRNGRRMFPYLALSVSGLAPDSLYRVGIQIVPASTRRFKYISNKWLPVGIADTEVLQDPYVHTDTLSSGGQLNKVKLIFSKVKLTNNKDSADSCILLHSMHKYRIVTTFTEVERKTHVDRPQSLSFHFPETDFIAVTAYQNEAVTQMKIHNNPFAKAFRDASYTAFRRGVVARRKRQAIPSNSDNVRAHNRTNNLHLTYGSWSEQSHDIGPALTKHQTSTISPTHVSSAQMESLVTEAPTSLLGFRAPGINLSANIHRGEPVTHASLENKFNVAPYFSPLIGDYSRLVHSHWLRLCSVYPSTPGALSFLPILSTEVTSRPQPRKRGIGTCSGRQHSTWKFPTLDFDELCHKPESSHAGQCRSLQKGKSSPNSPHSSVSNKAGCSFRRDSKCKSPVQNIE